MLKNIMYGRNGKKNISEQKKLLLFHNLKISFMTIDEIFHHFPKNSFSSSPSTFSVDAARALECERSVVISNIPFSKRDKSSENNKK